MKENLLVIADTSVILSLTAIDKLNLLNELFDETYIPQAVFEELMSVNNPVFKEKALEYFTPRVKAITQINNLMLVMDYGESEAVILYQELKARYLLIDDKHARQIAESLKVNCIGTLGILVIAKEKGIIKALYPCFRDLLKNKRFYSLDLLNGILSRNGENQLSRI